MMDKKIQLLDCTLRDGGNGLEALEKYYGDVAKFDKKTMKSLIETLQKTNIDIVEIGNIQPTDDDRTRFAQYQTIEEISKTMPQSQPEGQMYAALYRVPDVDLKTIPEWNKNLCRATRVVLRYSELRKSLDFAKGLAEKGYKVFIQPMVTMRYTNQDIHQVIDAANEMGAYAVYLVDSYGCMDFDDIDKIIDIYDSYLDEKVNIGFHAHNNMNMALSNTIYFINKKLSHNAIVDSCILGMGLSAGNLQTELISNYLNSKKKSNYNITQVLKACEIVNPLYERGLWGYQLEHLVGALRRTAYKYPPEYKANYGLSYSEIYKLLENMPDDYRYRFTKEYAKDWYEKNMKE